ncbi:hypothetical protein GQ55_3G111800 [Panicum hallii var. hallii]|uniref:Late embryogenesis abundant protein LEA-2 subgroup domain-containing protein n=1 Tax=Panicum hallii var. hallii TaxID=1504633 RepID=A0A2T7E882_9POAL|nr:hypothetical protein GQ55_3G111800 [Panicum hallii var. hallii]
MSTEPPSPASQRRRQCVAATAAAAAACLAPVVVFLAVLILAPSLIPRLLLRPHHVLPYVASAELRLMSFDAAASALAYNLSAVLRFDDPPGLYARRYTGVKAAPFYAGQELGAAVALPEFTQRRGGGGATLPVAWAGVQRVTPGRRARSVAAALARERAQGWISVKVAVRAAQDGDESDFACLLSFPVPSKRDGSGSGATPVVFDGGSCADAARGEF